MLDWLRRVMYGRYGNDSLNNALLVCAFVCMAMRWFFHSIVLAIFIWVFLILAYVRMFSRNLSARAAENEKFLKLWGRSKRKFLAQKRKFDDRKQHRYLKCPSCKMTLRVPRGRGKISVTCPKCHHQFVTKS